MVDIENYISRLIDALQQKLGTRLLYVGLQGSYLRGEANDSSDIDIMVVIDALSVADLDCYRAIIQSMEHAEKSCGFICSKADITHWNPLEICHLLNNTRDCFGELHALVPEYTEKDIRNFVKLSLNNLYHEICHRYIHAERNKSIEKLSGAYKSVFFILQNLYYLKNGEYIGTKSELLPLLEGKNRAVMTRAMELQNGIAYDFSESFELLFTWCQEALHAI